MKRLQNRIAESKNTLPAALVYGLGVWLFGGLVTDQLWLQFGLFVVTALLLVYLNNSIALLRVRSRMVSCTFIALTCCASQLFPSLSGGLSALCLTVALIFMFHSYHDFQVSGRTYFSFLFIGLISVTFIKVLWLVPLIWILMGTNMITLNVRTIIASLMGIITPYWFVLPWCLLRHDFSWLSSHLSQFVTFTPAFDLSGIPIGIVALFLFILIATSLGINHILYRGFEDKTRIRLTFGFLSILSVACMLFLIVQPQYYEEMMPIIIVLTCPVIGHYITLTSTRITNILFFIITALAVAITIFNLWMPSYSF